jgi:hypothetical protein
MYDGMSKVVIAVGIMKNTSLRIVYEFGKIVE